VVAVLVLAGAPVRALAVFVGYDNFDAASINPVKWTGFEFFGLGAEANRRIEGGMLRINYRAVGDTASNSGRTFSAFGLLMNKSDSALNAIKSLRVRVKVLAAQATNCASNPAPTSTLPPTQSLAGFGGAFFASARSLAGATNDVHALISLSRDPSDSNSSNLHVLAQVFRCANVLCSQVNWLSWKYLAGIAPTMGQLAATEQLRIRWDAAGNRFGFQRGNNTEEFISYTFSDSTTPNVPFKGVEAAHWAENCTTPQPDSIDALFDNFEIE
jgi:hypothetical protein